MIIRSRSMVFVFAAVIALAACSKKEETPPPAASAPAAAPVDPATVATITGTVKLDGAPPKEARLKTDSDPYCAKMHSAAPLVAEEVVEGKDGALANVIVYVKAGLENRSFPTPTETIELNQTGCQYKPHVIAVMVNQPISIVNSDQTTHNIHPTPANNRDWNKSQGPGADKITDSFAREEIAIPVKCNVHSWMKSYIAVLKNTFFKVTSADGTFELTGLPPGDYTIAAWQEKYGTTEQKITVGAKESKKVDFVFKAS
ncbi:MAG TPA: carboxypeptidase regulatory-like domain-containing protein [Candidatus Acidoferrales bacterium]|nr:carboxypeptidase regulatory-like domain-containing protein [Candidatus Acidoferrales bacterium]